MSKSILYANPKMAELRKNRGWTQEQFAYLLSLESGTDVSLSTVQKWEVRGRTIAAPMALEIAKALNAPVREVIDQERE